MLLVYVDDIIVTGNDQSKVKAFTQALHSTFALKDMGSLHYFLGIEVKRNANGLHLSQTKYIADLLKKYGMLHCAPCPTPMASGKSLSAFDGKKLKDPSVYRSAVGALQYVTQTRPDISFVVNRLSQFLHSPTHIHWKAVKRLLRYLKGTATFGLYIRCSSDLNFTGYTDADWACCPDDRRSVGGYCVFFGNSLISWNSHKQRVVARSSTESEYQALTDLAAELTWLTLLLHDLKFPLTQIPQIWCDNISAQALASNPVFHARTKHIELDAHFIRDQVLAKKVVVGYVPSNDQIADCMTKPLSHTKFWLFRTKLGVIDTPFA